MKKLLTILCALTINITTAQTPTPEPQILTPNPRNTNLTKYVHPIIGTRRMGHVFPGATVPFGMVQLSPETDTLGYDLNGHYNPDVYKYCAGYQYDDHTICGFSHTHFSGTGHSDLGDFLVMPIVGKLLLNPGTADKPGSGYRSNRARTLEISKESIFLN